jgi:uroporphyrinogen decarboxylase
MTAMPSKERVDRAMRGDPVDRPPFTFWYHFRLHNFPGERHAAATLDFHRRFRTDLVKVMCDYKYPRPTGPWYELPIEENPYPEQVRALEMIRDGLAGKAYVIETRFNPWNLAEKLCSPADVQQLKAEKPQALLDALEAIARSQINHARKAVQIGASGVFLAIGNAQNGVLTPSEYARFSEPFDRMILDAVKDSPMNVLHLHGDNLYFEPFYAGWPAAVINYSIHGTGIPLADVRRTYSGVLMGGLDEVNFRTSTENELREQWKAAEAAAGARFILSPGCSVPDNTADVEMLHLVDVLSA